MRRCCTALLMTLAAGAATAAPIYRCGQRYTQTPCANGRLIDSADPRTAAQRAEARRTAERERRMASQLERERQARESAMDEPTFPARLDAPAPPASEPTPAMPVKSKRKKTSKAKAAASKDFVAVAPTSRPKKAEPSK